MIPIFGLMTLLLGGGYRFARSLQLWRAQEGLLNGQTYQHSGLFGHMSKHYLLGIRVPFQAPFTCRMETGFDRWAKRWGLSQELQWGHAELDQKVFVVADSPSVRRILSGHSVLADHLLKLMDCQAQGVAFHSLTCHRGRLWVRFTGLQFRLSSSQSADLVLKCIPILQAIAQEFDQPDAVAHRFWHDRANIQALALGMFSTCLLIYGALLFRNWDVELGPILLPNSQFSEHAFMASCLIAALLLGLTFKWVRGTSRAHWIMLEVFISGGLGLTMLTFSTLKELNTLHDESDVRMVQAIVSDAWVVQRHSKRPKRQWKEFHIKLQANDDLPEMAFKVDGSVFVRSQPGQPLHLQLHRGKLGYPWVSNPQLLDN